MQIGDAIGDSAADAVSVSDTIDGDRSRASATRGLGTHGLENTDTGAWTGHGPRRPRAWGTHGLENTDTGASTPSDVTTEIILARPRPRREDKDNLIRLSPGQCSCTHA